MNQLFLDVTAVFCLLQYLAFGAMVGRARTKYSVAAPAITGSPEFERAYRVQMNTLELLVVLLPAMYIAARYWNEAYVAATGVVYLIGRVVYWRAYVKAPETRALGFLLSAIPCFVLIVVVIVGALHRL